MVSSPRLAALIFFCVFKYAVHAQGWATVIPGSSPSFTSFANDVAVGTDGGMLVAGYCFWPNLEDLGFTTYLSADGVQLDPIAPALEQYESVIALPNGGYALLGYSFDERGAVFVTRITASGLVLWKKKLQLYPDYGGNYIYRHQLERLNDGSFLVSCDLPDADSTYVARVSSAGDSLWTKSFPAINTYVWVRPDNTFLFSDNQGNLWQGTPDGQWTPQPGELDSVSSAVYQMYGLSDGHALVVGYWPTGSSKRWKKINAQGEVVWTREPPSLIASSSEKPYVPTPDGGFAVCMASIAGPHFYFYKYDANGELQWEKNIRVRNVASNAQIELYSLKQTADGGYLFAGFIRLTAGQAPRPLVIRTDALGNIYAFEIIGSVLYDEDQDCQVDSTDDGQAGWILALTTPSSNYAVYGTSEAAGTFVFGVDPGNYVVGATVPNPYWELCQSSISITLDTAAQAVNTASLLVQPVVSCPFLETDIGTPFLRRCFNNNYSVRYCNTGTVAADNAYVRVTLDPAMAFIGSTQPVVDEGNGVLRFDIGVIEAGDCGAFPFTVYLDCDSTVLGQTHCVEAHIYPDSLCINSPGWSGAQIDVGGACQPDSVRFVIRNTGTAASSLLDYIVIEDNIIYFQDQFQLPANDSLKIAVPANGSTWRVEAEQEPGAPANPMPSITIEGCGANAAGAFSIGFVSQFGEADGDPFVSVDCRPNVAAYDPNDKQGFPLGYGSEHFIEPDQAIEYLIRFQNTGTDTAFTVVIADTLDTWLDRTSVVPGAGSHPYRFELTGFGTLKFIFENIQLPDSNVNESLSHGFVKFRVKPRAGIPLGTVVNNRAAIYFDFNPPVITNEIWHTIGEEFIVVHTRNPWAEPACTVWPNPARAGQVLTVRSARLDTKAATIQLFDVTGRRVAGLPLREGQVRLPADLPGGVYFFQVRNSAKGLGNGRIVVW